MNNGCDSSESKRHAILVCQRLLLAVLTLMVVPLHSRANMLSGESQKESIVIGSKLDPYLYILKYKAQNELLLRPANKTYVRVIMRVNEDGKTIKSFPIFSNSGGIVSSYCSLDTLDEIERDKNIQAAEVGSCVLQSQALLTYPDDYKVEDRDGMAQEKRAHSNNVIVGIIDTGMTIKDGFLYDKDANKTNIISYWDQIDQSGKSPLLGEQGYGTEYCSRDIIHAVKTGEAPLLEDKWQHGTTIARICCGKGGMYPGADIIFVKTNKSKASILDGVRYIDKKARELSRPCVINLSYGMNYGGNCGTSLFEQGMESSVGPGRIIVSSAGNIRAREVSFAAHSEGMEDVLLGIQINPKYIDTLVQNRFRINFTIEVTGRFGAIEIKPLHTNNSIGVINPGEAGRFILKDDSCIYYAWKGKVKDSIHEHAVIRFEGTASAQTLREWTISFKPELNKSHATCHINAWLVDGYPAMRFFNQGNAYCQKTLVPAVAQRIIAVASCSASGQPYSFSPEPIRVGDAYVKPDYYVYGNEFGSDITAQYDSRRDTRDTFGSEAEWGTSFSAALVSGCVAWILERHQEYGINEVRAVLDKYSTYKHHNKNLQPYETMRENIKKIDLNAFQREVVVKKQHTTVN